uniref:Multicopper oxidase n=1 Tax=Ganoderma boninense TaxID=34458 RepID=A0A5K1K8E5_9APHY|nr:Multicopper oxidase [Ganoderma boninense]
MAKGTLKISIRPRRARAAAARTPSVHEEDEDVSVGGDEEQQNTSDPSLTESAPQTPQADAEEDEPVDIDNADDAEPSAQGSPVDQDDVMDDVEPTPVRKRGRPRGRGRGAVGSGTPRATRARGRGRGRGRGRAITIKLPKRGGEEGQDEEPSEVAEASTQEAAEPEGGGKPFARIQGKVYVIDGDEYVTDDDPKGDTKIDVQGNLLGGRRFKAQTFVLPNRHPERKYMLAIDAARTSGFRDSLYYFRRNPLAMKLNATQWEKDHLIEVGKLGSHLKTRSVTLVTARSAYKLHGAKTLAEGRWVIDDYYEDKSMEDILAKGLKPGDLVGELQDTSNLANEAAALAAGASGGGGQGGKGERSGGTIGMYRAGGPTTIFGPSGWGPYSDGPLNAVRKSYLTRDGVNEENWMYVAADRTAEMSNEWTKLRKEALKVCGGILADTLDGEIDIGRGEKRSAEEIMEEDRRKRDQESRLPLGVYEPQTGIVLYRSDSQPTQAHWEVLPDSPGKTVLGGTKVGGAAWGLAWLDTVMETPHLKQEDEWAKERAKYMDLIRTEP